MLNCNEDKFMTNYEKLFKQQMQNDEFVKAYQEAHIERVLNEFLDNLKEKISRNESKENLLCTIDSMQRQLNSIAQ